MKLSLLYRIAVPLLERLLRQKREVTLDIYFPNEGSIFYDLSNRL